MSEEKRPIILIVEKEELIRRMLQEILEEEFEILECPSPKESMELLTHRTVDLILSADIFSEMSGTALCQSLKTKKKFLEIPLILMIEHEDILLIRQALEAGVANFLRKPFNRFNVHAAIQVALNNMAYVHHLHYKIRKLKRHAERDPLTNFYNRYVLYEQGKKEVSKAQRGNLPLSILMVDIDGFKIINDALGHIVGDEVLMEFSDLLSSTLRSIDLTARFGGEEFVILLPKTSSEQALVVAEKIRMTVAAHLFHTGPAATNLTVSIGVATLSQTSRKLEQLLEDIDNALYKAKQKGRNQVVLFELT